MPAPRAAAHVPLNLSGVVLAPGMNSDQVWPSPWIKSLSPAGAQLNACTALSCSSSRGKPESLTIHNPPATPPAPTVLKVSQFLKRRGGPVVKRTDTSRLSWVPLRSKAPVVTVIW